MKKICCKEIDDYILYYEQCPNVFNNERKLLIENIVKPTLERDDIFFDEKMYRNCLRFVDRWYYPLFPYQKFIYAFVFMYDKDGLLVFKEFDIIMGRGNGKDGFIIPLLHFLTTQYYGVENYNVDIIANSEEQAQDSFMIAHDVMESNETLFKKYFYWNLEYFVNRITKSRFKFHTSNAKTKDGKKPGALLFNEYHQYETYDQIKVFKSGKGKVKDFRVFVISSNGNVRGGPLDELLKTDLKILKSGVNKLRRFPFICKLDDISEVDKNECWIKANPSYEYLSTLREAIMDDYLEQLESPSLRSEFLCKRMNLPAQSHESVLIDWDLIERASYSDVENQIARPYIVKPKQRAIIGIDFASTNDFASVGVLTKNDDEYQWRQYAIINSSSKYFKDIKFPFDRIGLKGYEDFIIVDYPVINERIIINKVLEYFSEFNIVKIILDSYKYQLLKLNFEQEGISIEDKNNPTGLVRMLRYPASIAAIIGPKIQAMFALKKINIGDSAIMRWAINNTSIEIKKDGNMMFNKVEPKLRKNDPFMAFVAAFSSADLLEEKVEYVYI